MDMPFPVLTPRLIDPKWFNADSPCDEDADLIALEQAHQQKLNAIGLKYMKRTPLGKNDAEPMEEEADTDDEEGNDVSDDSEESHDEDEEEELQTTYSPVRNNNDLEVDGPDSSNVTADISSLDQNALWSVP